jgi:plastocyanin
LVAILAFAVGCGGGGEADLETLATEAAGTAPSAQQSITADGLKFDKDTLVVPAGARVTISFDNQDGGTTHNLAVYQTKDAKENLYRGDLFSGDEKRDYAFQAPAAGVYYFRCDAHPDMDGVFIAK